MHELAGRTSKIGLTADSQGAPTAVALLVPPGCRWTCGARGATLWHTGVVSASGSLSILDIPVCSTLYRPCGRRAEQQVMSRPILAHWGGGCLHSAVPLVSGGEISSGFTAALASGNGRAVSSLTGDGKVKAAPLRGQTSPDLSQVF